MLGHSGRVVWYVPSREDVPAGDEAGLTSLLPVWLGPVVALGGVAFVGLVLWRGRRFGRLVPEPLPVVVRAVETTESRGRLYRRARDASRAGATLQLATRTRLADYLGLPRPTAMISSRGADQALVATVSAASGRPVDEVGALLSSVRLRRGTTISSGSPPSLAALEKEVRRSQATPRTTVIRRRRRRRSDRHTRTPANRSRTIGGFPRPTSATPPQAQPEPPPAAGPAPPLSSAAQQASDRARESLLAVRREVGKAVVGQEAAVSGVIICLLVRGHVLLEGVPGVAKTLLVRALAKALAIDTKRAVHPRPDAR